MLVRMIRLRMMMFLERHVEVMAQYGSEKAVYDEAVAAHVKAVAVRQAASVVGCE